jgi:hypothetical protein
MDGQVMADESMEPRTQLALDTDWGTAMFTAFVFVFFLLALVVTARHVLLGAPVKLGITWGTWFMFLGFTLLAIRLRERIVKFLCVLIGVMFGSRLFLSLIHASFESQVLNGEIMRVVDLLVDVGFCLYIASWFKQRIRRI